MKGLDDILLVLTPGGRRVRDNQQSVGADGFPKNVGLVSGGLQRVFQLHVRQVQRERARLKVVIEDHIKVSKFAQGLEHTAAVRRKVKVSNRLLRQWL